MTQLLQLVEPGGTEATSPKSDKIWVGIDLGTTHSLVCQYLDGKPVFFKDEQGRHIFPSVVNYTKSGDMVSIADISDTEGYVSIHSIKRKLARGNIVTLDKRDDVAFTNEATVNVGRVQLSPIDISAEILNHLKLVAEDNLDAEVHNAVITVPAYFDEVARMATRRAAEYAGFEEVTLLSEPTAAALAFGLSTDKPGLYGVYDLGGGTFDFSLLRCEQGFFRVLGTVGDTNLGGDDFDAAIADHLKRSGAEFETRADAILAARKLKHELTLNDEVTFINRGNYHRIDRQTFEGYIQHFVARTVALCSHALDEASVSWNELNGILLVGGSTRVPLVAAELKKVAACAILDTLHPDEAVAQGAAIRAHQLVQGSAHNLADVTPLSLGVETIGGVVERIIERNTPIPVTSYHEFTTFKDNQDAISLHIVQGERELAEDCRTLGRFSLTGIPPMKAGAARVRVVFSLSADGLLSVEAYEKSTGVRQGIDLKPSYGLHEAHMEEMVKKSLQHANEDMEKRLLIQMRQKAAQLATTGRGLQKVLKSKIPGLDEALSELEKLAEGTDRPRIRDEVKRVESILKPFIEDQFQKHLNSSSNSQAKRVS